MAPNWDKVMLQFNWDKDMLHYYDYRHYKPLTPAQRKGFTFVHFVKAVVLILGLVLAADFFHAYWIALKS